MKSFKNKTGVLFLNDNIFSVFNFKTLIFYILIYTMKDCSILICLIKTSKEDFSNFLYHM